MRKSFELFDGAFERSIIEDLGHLSAGTITIAVAALLRPTNWWSSDTAITLHVCSFADGNLMNDALDGAVWAGLLCLHAEPRRSLSLCSSLNVGETPVSGNTIELPLWRNGLVLFDSAALRAEIVPAPADDETGLWLVCATLPSGVSS